MKMLLLLFVGFVHGKECYWNAKSVYPYYGTKTPYDTVRGDIRDQEIPQGCEAISVWRINRHGNRNPSTPIVANMKDVVALKDEIIASFDKGKSELCAQDIENLKLWTWKPTVDDAHSFLTKTGYEELYNIGKRFAQKYHHLLQGTPDQFYLRATNEQRSVTSCTGFVHGMTDVVPLNVTVDNPLPKDEVVRPYETCDRYRLEVKAGKILVEQETNYFKSREYVAVQKAVQKRLGIATVLTAENILAFYQLCRYFRPWNDNLRCPWCAIFTNKDLVVMEYSDDVSHYFKKGYGSWINVNLGKAPLKDLYENFEAVVAGEGRKLVAYFSHDTMLEMIYCALGLYSDNEPIKAASRETNRKWRSSLFGAYSSNFMAILNRCRFDQHEVLRVQFFINENETPLCPAEGCSWQQFQEKFHPFTASNLSFCHVPSSKLESFYRHAKRTN